MSTARSTPERSLFVSWRDPQGSIHPVGLLLRRMEASEERFSFAYLKGAERLADFVPLPGLPDLHRRYDSTDLFPVFANRIMPRSRPDFDLLAERIDLAGDADPFEVLARTGGRRATDRIEVFSAPVRTEASDSCALFFARGIRHVPGASDAVSALAVGDRLVLIDDGTNEHNPRAVVLRADDGQQIGWIPDYLVEHVHDLRHLNGSDPIVEVEHVNDTSVASHLRLLCRMTAPWPEGYEPFTDALFEPLVPLRP